MYNDISSIIDRLDNRKDIASNLECITLTKSTDNLKTIKNILYDYITNIFSTKDYTENLYYYHYILNSVKITGKIVDKILEIRDKD